MCLRAACGLSLEPALGALCTLLSSACPTLLPEQVCANTAERVVCPGVGGAPHLQSLFPVQLDVEKRAAVVSSKCGLQCAKLVSTKRRPGRTVDAPLAGGAARARSGFMLNRL